jgi:small-conductance mechanosensitive channel
MTDLLTWAEKLQTFFNSDIGFPATALKILAAVLGAWVVWLIIKHALTTLEKRLKGNDWVETDTRTFQIIRQPICYLLVFITGNYIIELLDMHFLDKGFFAALIILVATPLKNLALILIAYYQRNIALRTDTQVDNIIFDLLNKFSGAAIYATAGILALDILGINVMPFIAGAGVAGVAIGFAAKDTLSNLIAGVLLIIDRPFEIGDRIEVWSAPSGSATWGDVIDIGLRATKIRTTDNIVIIIPNNEIMKRDIVNYTIINTKIRLRIDIGVSYDTEIRKAKEAILNVANTNQWVSKTPPPKVVVRNFGESSVDLQLRVWIDNARDRMNTISDITDKVKDVFDEEGIEIPYPKRDINIVGKEGPTGS